MMLETCRAAIDAALKPLGLKDVLREESDGGAFKAKPYGLLAWGDEDLRRSHRRIGQTDDRLRWTRTITDQVAVRTIPLQVRLVADTTDQLDRLVDQFLTNLPARLIHADMGVITVALRGAETPPAEGVVRQKAQWDGVVEFTGSVIRTRTVRLFNLAGELSLESEVQM